MAMDDKAFRLPRRAIGLSFLVIGCIGVIGWLSHQTNRLVDERNAALINESVPALRFVGDMQEQIQQHVVQLHLYYSTGDDRHWHLSRQAHADLRAGLTRWGSYDLSSPPGELIARQLATMAQHAANLRVSLQAGPTDVDRLTGRPSRRARMREHLGAAQDIANQITLRLSESAERLRQQVVARGSATTRDVARLNRLELMLRLATVILALVVGAIVVSRVRDQRDLIHVANADRLTGLPNFYRLQLDWEEMRPSNRAPPRDHTLVLLRVDRFQLLSGALGLQSGNQVELAVIERVRAMLHGLAGVDARVYHMTAGTLLVLFRDDRERHHSNAFKEALLSSSVEPLQAGERELSISLSLGLAYAPEHASGIDELLQCAGASLNAAQNEGGDRAVIYREEIKARAEEFLAMESALRANLRVGGFELHYQPKLSADELRCVGCEALLRWRRDDGWVSPAQFIPVAEASGLILPLGRWVLQQAARQWRAWLDDDLPPFPVAVNVSAQQFLAPSFVEEVATTLHEFGMPPSMLELEITEEATFGDAERASLTLRALKALGVRLAIDDFGTGYSSLSYLTEFPLDTIKIDRKFVADMDTSTQHRSIVEMIVTLAHKMELTIVAEGVETEAQQDTLRSIGCTALQGFLYSRPLNPSDYRLFLRRNLVEASGLDGNAARQAVQPPDSVR